MFVLIYDSNTCFRSGSTWLRVTPKGFRRTLNYIKDTYNNVPVYVTENGVTDNNGTIHDQHRITYYSQYINEMLKGTYFSVCHFKGKMFHVIFFQNCRREKNILEIWRFFPIAFSWQWRNIMVFSKLPREFYKNCQSKEFSLDLHLQYHDKRIRILLKGSHLCKFCRLVKVRWTLLFVMKISVVNLKKNNSKILKLCWCIR